MNLKKLYELNNFKNFMSKIRRVGNFTNFMSKIRRGGNFINFLLRKSPELIQFRAI
jgi:hypothetical protein